VFDLSKNFFEIQPYQVRSWKFLKEEPQRKSWGTSKWDVWRFKLASKRKKFNRENKPYEEEGLLAGRA